METELEVREAVLDDLAGAIELLRQQLVEHEIDLAAAELARAVRALVTRPELGRVLVAVRPGDRGIVGVAALSFLWTLEHGGPAAWLDELYVEPAERGRGIGGRLVDGALQVARARGCVALDLEVEAGHEAVERLYRRRGFRRHRRARWVRPLGALPPAASAEEPSAPGRTAPKEAASACGGSERAPDRRPFPSIDHLSLGVNDLARAKAFYDAALAPLGLVAHEQIAGEVAYGPPGESPEEGFAFYVGFEDPAAKRPVTPSAGFHVAVRAPSRQSVREFHAAALAAGGRDLGAPGLRPRYHPDYYGAFVLDPDGHHVEAVCHAPEEC